jgi:hypothetical protein
VASVGRAVSERMGEGIKTVSTHLFRVVVVVVVIGLAHQLAEKARNVHGLASAAGARVGVVPRVVPGMSGGAERRLGVWWRGGGIRACARRTHSTLKSSVIRLQSSMGSVQTQIMTWPPARLRTAALASSGGTIQSWSRMRSSG